MVLISLIKMSFKPRNNVEDCIALVVNKNDSRYGHIAKIKYHDWKEFGLYGILFKDGAHKEYYDGWMKGDNPSSIRIFYRHNDQTGKELDKEDAGLESLKKTYLSLNVGNLETLAAQYRSLFHERLP